MRALAPVSFFTSAVIAAFAAACSSPSPPPDQVSVSEIEGPPAELDASLSSTPITLPVGIVVEIEVQTSEDAGAIAVIVDDPTRVSVLPMVTPGDFALVGIAPGSANLSLSVGGEVVPSFTIDGTLLSTLPIAITPPPQWAAIDASSELFVGATVPAKMRVVVSQ
jgi:hypothetical protein